MLRLGAGQIYLIYDWHNVQVMIQRKVYIGQRLSLHALSRVHHKNRSVTGRKAPGHLVVKVNMTRRVNQVKDIFFPVFRLVDDTHRLRFDGNAPFPLKLHIVKHLRLHLTAGKQACHLNDAVCKRRFPMINMCNNTKISDFTLIYLCHFYRPSISNLKLHPSMTPSARVCPRAHLNACSFGTGGLRPSKYIMP